MKSAPAMIPIVFCASLAPCIRLKAAAETSCILRKNPSTRRGVWCREDPLAHRHQQQADEHADQRREDDEDQRERPSARNDGNEAGLGDGGARVSAEQRVRGTRGQPVVPGHQVPDDGARQPREDHRERDDAQVDHARADRLSDGRAESERRDEVEERRPDDRLPGRQHPGRDDRGDRVGRVVEAVDVVEDQRDRDERENGEQRVVQGQRSKVKGTKAAGWLR